MLSETSIAHLVDDVRIALKGQGVENPLFHAVKLVEGDEFEVAMHKETLGMIDDFKASHSDEVFGTDYEALVADGRYKFINKHFSVVVKHKNNDRTKMTKSDKVDKVLTHRIWGIPIFLVILFLIFHLTFSENLFFLNGFNESQNWMPSLSENEVFLVHESA